MLEPLNTLT